MRARLARARSARQTIDGSLIALSAILGCNVHDASGRLVGQLDDVIVKWPRGSTYPAVSAIVIREGKQTFAIGGSSVRIAAPTTISIAGSGVYTRAPERRPGDIALAHDVLDHQLFDESGAEVMRPADLYLATVHEQVELAGVEVGVRALLRRLGPRRLRERARPQRVIDWSDIAGFVNVRTAAQSSRRRGTGLAGATGTGVKMRGETQTTLDADEVSDKLQGRSPGSGGGGEDP